MPDRTQGLLMPSVGSTEFSEMHVHRGFFLWIDLGFVKVPTLPGPTELRGSWFFSDAFPFPVTDEEGASWADLCPPKFVGWSPNSQFLRL